MSDLRHVCSALLAALILCLVPGLASAIDNPDAPDHLAAFEARDSAYRERLEDYAVTTEEDRTAWARYLDFLDDELNTAYDGLIDVLDDRERMILRESQRKWLAYRDAEFDFIHDNWTRERFGSSVVISRGQYRAAIVRVRVQQLLAYLMNY